MKKTILNVISRVVKLGWNTPTLPEKVMNIHNHPFVRFFRVVGGISIITVLSNKHLFLFLPFKFIVLFLALLHFIYISSISIIKLIYGFKILKSDKLNVINSPLDHLVSATGKLLYCWKFACQAGSDDLGLVSTSFKRDSLLEAGNHNKVFTPLVGKSVKFVGGKPAYNISSVLNKKLKQKKDIKKRIEINNMIDKTNGAMDSYVFSKDVLKPTISALYRIKYVEKRKLQLCSKYISLAKEIKKYYDISNKINVLIKYIEKNYNNN